MPGGSGAVQERPREVAGLTLVRLVGHGGEGEVWEATDPRGRRRALKLIRPEALADPDEVERRSRYLVRIDHPALVRVHRAGMLCGGGLDGWGFLEMDFIDGPSLADAPADPWAPDELWPLAEALDLLHAGVWSDGVALVHRDVKPANLVRGGEGCVVLVDPSTLRDVADDPVTRIGTPAYAAPEAVTGRAGPPADVYGFAATVVALRTGARGRELARLVERPEELDVPEAVRAALSPLPGDRPVSCRAVLGQPAGRRGSEPAGTRIWSWIGALWLVVGVPLAAWAFGAVSGEALAALVAVSGGAHLAAHALARRPVLAALLAPPLAWAFLVADRVPGPVRRQAWVRAVSSGALLAACGPLLAWALGASAWLDPGPVVGVVVGGLCVMSLGVAAANAGGGGGRLLRLALAPAWLVGAAVLIGGAVACLPLAATAGAGRTCLRLATRTLASVADFW